MLEAMEEREHSLHSLLLDVPKIDLHCHLNGSISASLLNYLQNLHNINLQKIEHKCEQQKTETDSSTKTTFVKTSLSQDAISIVDPQTRMHECFKMFDLIYNVMDNLTFTKLAVQDLLFHSAMERVCVLEIRTSLRDAMRVSYQHQEEQSTLINKMASKQEYLQTVIDTVEHLLTGHGVVCFTSGAFLHLDQMTPEVQKQWEMEFESIYTNSFLHNAQSINGSKNNSNVKVCEVLHQRILPHLQSHMHVRLLVSVNRAKSIAESEEAISLAINLQHAQVEQFYEWLRNTIKKCNTVECASTNKSSLTVLESEMKSKMQHTCWITGVDFSGNCYKNAFHDYTSSLSRARFNHINNNSNNNNNNNNLECNTISPLLAVTLHAAEKYDDDELLEMISFCPQRFGHLVFINDKINLLLKQILCKGTGIELCMSSNLVTCGHTTAEQHHLGPLLQLWWNVAPNNLEECKEINSKSQQKEVVEVQSDGESHDCEKELVHDEYNMESILLSDEGYNNSEQLRLAHRLARWHREESQEKEELCELENAKINKVTENVATSTHYNRSTIHKTSRLANYSIPNISFHTDDRGVFDISLTSELGLVCSHPLFCANRNYYDKENCTNRNASSSSNIKEEQECVKVIHRLERLTLTQVFELPWPVLYLTYIVLSINVSDKDDTNTRNECLLSFAHFAHMCNELFYNHNNSSSSSSNNNRDNFSAIMTCMSQWELRWLSDNFDSLLE